MVLAAQALAKTADSFSWRVGQETGKGALTRAFSDDALAAGPVTIVNEGAAPASLVVTTNGHPLTPEPAAWRGYEVTRAFHHLDGSRVEGPVKQNERIVVVLNVIEREAKQAKLLLVDRLPAGLEIDNPRLVDSGSVAGLSWLGGQSSPTHAEYRDDRFVAAFDRDGSELATLTVAYIARAVTPGRYVLPPAEVEDMYRPERYGRAAFGVFEVAAP